MLTNDFILLCKEYTQNRQDVLNETVIDNKKFCRYNIEFLSYILEIVYVKKETTFYKPSSLYCTIKLRKNSVVHYHLTDIIPYIKEKSFNACYFTTIENTDRLSCCFKSLTNEIENVTSQIDEFLFDDTLLLEQLYENYKLIFNLKDKDLDFSQIDNKNDYAHNFFTSLQKSRDGFVFSRFSSFAPYEALVKKQNFIAITKYEKLNMKGKLFDYEKDLLNHIVHLDCDFTALSPECNTKLFESKFLTLGVLVKTAFTFFAIFSVIFCCLFACYNLTISRNTVITLCAPWYCGFLCAGLCAVFGSITYFQKMPNKYLTKKQREDFAKITISKPLKFFCNALFVLSIITSIFFAITIAKENVRFYDESINFSSKNYRYEQIDSVYYIKSRHNLYGDKINRASYVILFKDKTSLDLDGYTSVESTQKHVLPFLEDKNIEIKEADSEKQLPWYSES